MSIPAKFATKTSYYTVKAGWSLKRLFNTLRNTTKKIWRIGNAIEKIGNLAGIGFKTFRIGGSAITLLRLLPMLPPVIVGIHIFFASFWPKRVLFFHASQRNGFIGGLRGHWFGIFFLLLLALIINTVLIDEVVNAFNEALPLANVHVKKKLGWKFSIAASAFSICSALSFYLCYYILGRNTLKNHEKITKDEAEWRAILESKNKTTYKNPFGDKIEWKNQIKYKKERIRGSNWILPITFCLISCGLGVVANLYPKIEIFTEPKGSFGRILDDILSKISIFDNDLEKVKEDAEYDCIPFATFGDVISDALDEKKNILLPFIHDYFEAAEKVLKPLRQILKRTRQQFVSHVGEELFGEDVVEHMEDLNELDLRYLGMILLAPRVLALFTLIFGSLVMARASCKMKIRQDPRKIVDFYGSLCIFSVIFVLGTQMALYNILSDIGVPFYKISVRLGLGFMYDIAADAIMCSVYIGMKNEYFFAIPRRKVTVTYSVPGVSDYGPNIRNRIL